MTDPIVEVEALSQRNRSILLLVILFSWSHCGESSDDPVEKPDSASEKETTPSDQSTGSDDSDVADTSLPCLGGISGRVLKNGTEGIKALVVVCMGLAICHDPQITKADGAIEWRYPDMKAGETCIRHDFAGDEWLHIEILAQEDPEDYASYSFVLRPTTEDISDGGSDDHTLDIGNLALYELPSTSETYVPSTGATVDLEGVSFELPPDGLIKESLKRELTPLELEHEIRIFEAPLDEWEPPFSETLPDALYYVGPRWAQVADPGVVLSLAPPDGWSEGDVGTMALLGSWRTTYANYEGLIRSEYMYLTDAGRCVNESDENERVPEGFTAECGEVEVKEGRIITPPIPRLTWIAVFK